MPEQVAGEVSSWTPESVEKQAAELEQKQQPEQKPQAEAPSEQVEGEQQAEPEKKERDKTDNLVSAVTELRAQRREAHARATQLEQQNQQLTRQMQELMTYLQTRQGQAQGPAADDVLGQMQHGISETKETVARLAQAEQQRLQQQAQQDQWQRYVSAVKSQEAEFSKAQPDAPEAINFLKTARVNEYKALGMPHDQAVQQMLQDERNLVDYAMRTGENPAKAAFDMAVARGYVSPKQKLAMQREGQGASMPSGGAGKGGGTPSLEALLKMDSKDFAKATEGDNWEKLLRKFG